MSDESSILAQFVARLAEEPLPTEVCERAKQSLADAVGVALRAATDAEMPPIFQRALRELYPEGRGPATFLGLGTGQPAVAAAWMNGALIHVLDFDDTHSRAGVHPGAPVIGAALAAAELADASGELLLRAIVAGYEATCRIGMALNPVNQYERGFHPTCTAGAFGAAAAAGLILGLTADQMLNAWGLTLSLASGSMQFLESGSWNKPIQVGWAAHNGLIAAQLSRAGLRGARWPLEGRYGLLHMCSDDTDATALIAGIGRNWMILETGVKVYPCCRFCHAALDGIIDIAVTEDLHPRDVTAIEIGLSSKALDLITQPRDRKLRPQTVVDAQFSMYWTAAAALCHRRLVWEDYEHLGDEGILALAGRVTTSLDREVDRALPDHWAARVSVSTARGTVQRFVLDPRGEPVLPVGWDGIAQKFSGLVGRYLGQQRCQDLLGAIRTLDSVASVRDLTGMIHLG